MQIVRVRVLDATTDPPVANALITLVGDPAQAYTDSAGIAIMHLRRGGANIFLMKRDGEREARPRSPVVLSEAKDLDEKPQPRHKLQK